MKNTWLMVGACAFFMGGFCMDSSLKAQQHSSFKPGQEWSDAQGNHINAHGGGILFYNDTYYWYVIGMESISLRIRVVHWWESIVTVRPIYTIGFLKGWL